MAGKDEKILLDTFYKVEVAVLAEDKESALEWLQDACIETFGNGYFRIEEQ